MQLPSPNSPTLSCQSDNSMIMSTTNSSFVSPPPPSVPGAACPPGQQQLGMTIDSIQVLPPMFPPQPALMSPQPFMSPCVRYTSFPLQQTMFSLLPDQHQMKGGMQTPAQPPLQYQPVPEVSIRDRGII